jgi:hypothetical protein
MLAKVYHVLRAIPISIRDVDVNSFAREERVDNVCSGLLDGSIDIRSFLTLVVRDQVS